MKLNKYFKLLRITLLFLSIFVISVYGVNAVGTAPNPADTTAYYKFDGNTTDATPNGNDATNYGLQLTTGIINQGYGAPNNGDTNNRYRIDTGISINPANTITKNAWFKTSGTGIYMITPSSQEIDMNAGKIRFRVRSGTTYVTSNSYNDGEWHMVTLTYDGTTAKGYIDGEFISNINVGTKTDSVPLSIGGRDNDFPYSFVGAIDEVAIFNYSLSSDEITYLYQSGTPTSDQQYPFGSTPVTNGTLTFTNISVNGETFVNHSYINTNNLEWYVEVLNTSTNGNVNISYSLSQNNPIFNNPTKTISNTYSIRDSILSADKWCQENTQSSYVSFTSRPNNGEGCYWWNGISWQGAMAGFCNTDVIENLTCENQIINSSQFSTNSLNGTFNLTSLNEGNYNLILLAENNETNVSTSLNFTIDTTNPSITFNNNTEFNTYTINLSELNILAIDSNFANMTIDWDDGTSNFTTSTTFSGTKTFTTNGNHTFNITARDLANNHITVKGQLLINPTFYVYFNNNTVNLENFTINDVFYEKYFTEDIYDYGLGVFNFTFKKAGFEEIDFQLNFTINFTVLNQTKFTSPVFLIFILKDLKNGSNAPNNNYSFFITEVSTGDFNTYSITNDNTLTIENLYTDKIELQITVVLNETLSNTIQLISARQNVTVPIYINFETTSARIIEVKTSTLIAIPNNEVFIYKYIDGEGFILETIKTTNSLGQIFINVVENTAIYTVCSTYLNEEVCLNQITFQNVETDPFELIFSSNYKTIERDELDFITWSFSEEKNLTAETSQITFTFDDRQSIIQKFCIDVTRRTNDTDSYLGEFCNNNPSGQVVQTFSLANNQRIEYIFSYYIDGEKVKLSTYYSYGENAQLNELIKLSILDIIFLFSIFGIISLLLNFNNFTIYNVGFLSASLGILLIQSYINKDFVTASIWSFLFLKTIVLYMTKGGNN